MKTDIVDFRFFWIMWGQIATSILMFMGICHLLISFKEYQSKWGPDFPYETIKISLFVLSLTQFVLIHFQRKFQLKPREKDRKTNPVGKYSNVCVISWLIAWLIGVYATFLFLVKPDFQTLYIFIGISLITMIVYRPKLKEFENLVWDMEELEIGKPARE